MFSVIITLKEFVVSVVDQVDMIAAHKIRIPEHLDLLSRQI